MKKFCLAYVGRYATSKNAKIAKNDKIHEKCPGKQCSKIFSSASEWVRALNSTFSVRYYLRLPRNQSEIIAQASVKTRRRAKLPKKIPKKSFFFLNAWAWFRIHIQKSETILFFSYVINFSLACLLPGVKRHWKQKFMDNVPGSHILSCLSRLLNGWAL